MCQSEKKHIYRLLEKHQTYPQLMPYQVGQSKIDTTISNISKGLNIFEDYSAFLDCVFERSLGSTLHRIFTNRVAN